MSAVTARSGQPQARRELAHRRAGDLDVWLVWSPDDDSVSVEIHDRALGTWVAVAVGSRPALHVFHHPFAYAREAGLGAGIAA